jgi:hypothetical protein
LNGSVTASEEDYSEDDSGEDSEEEALISAQLDGKKGTHVVKQLVEDGLMRAALGEACKRTAKTLGIREITAEYSVSETTPFTAAVVLSTGQRFEGTAAHPKKRDAMDDAALVAVTALMGGAALDERPATATTTARPPPAAIPATPLSDDD